MSQAETSHTRCALYPWSIGDCSSELNSEYSRRSIIVSGDVDEIVANVCDDSLPEVARWHDHSGRCWKRFELPCATWSENRSVATYADLSLSGQRIAVRQTTVQLSTALPRPGIDFVDKSDAEEALTNAQASEISLGTEVVQAAIGLQRLTDWYADFINDLVDHPRPHRHYWEENVDGAALRSVQRVLTRWKQESERDEVRLALIVKLARDLPNILADVGARPRVVLRRVREMQNVGLVQEIDAACLRWLARQPGRTIIEKAGRRQQVLGIVRVEDADTPENRVVRDFILRANRECLRYLAEYRCYPSHPRVQQVRRFRKQTRDLRYESVLGTASALVGAAQPNYVLQHEPRYHKIWEAYILLVHQQKQLENIWRWRERCWAEMCQLAIWNSLAFLGYGGSALRSDVRCRDEQMAGRFFDASVLTATWTSRNEDGSRVDVLPGVAISRYPHSLHGLSSLSPDWVAVHHAASMRLKVTAIWPLLQAPLTDEVFLRSVERLDASLQAIPFSVRGIIVVPDVQSRYPEVSSLGRVRVIALRLPLSKASEVLGSSLFDHGSES